VEIAGPILFALFGLVLAALIWVVSRSLASEQLPALQPGCPYCPGSFPSLAWVPLFGAPVRCTNCRRTTGQGRWFFELGMAASFAIAAARIESALTLIEFALFTIPLSFVLLIDFWTGTVFRNLVFLGILLGLVMAAIRGFDTLVESAQGMLAGFVIFGAGMLLFRKVLPAVQLAPIGGGDVLIAGMIGAMARWPGTLFAFFAGVGLAVIGVALVLFLQRTDRSDAVPFGPFLCAAAIPVFALTF
jgi:prepilin signal peptidase PulO-like enzyme (type II secretory pathway)